MKKSDYKARLDKIIELEIQEEFDTACTETKALISELFQEKEYELIISLSNQVKSEQFTFELAYSYSETGRVREAESMYDTLISYFGEDKNTSILNNLAIIKEKRGDIISASELISKAKKIDQADEVISKNFIRIISNTEHLKASENHIVTENKWVLGKLSTFLSKVKADKLFKNNRLPIPMWKFKAYIGTDDQKALSLRTQWIQKNYIIDTKTKDQYSVTIYEINPFLSEFIEKHKPLEIPDQWVEGVENLNIEVLKKIEYFAIHKNILKISKKYASIMIRDFDELVINYVYKNKKATIVLAGSFIELLFTYYCDKKLIKIIEYTKNGKATSYNLFEAKLFDFITFFEEKHILTTSAPAIGDMARIYRNYIHPGKEIRSKEELNDSKLEMCFHSVLELIKQIIK